MNKEILEQYLEGLRTRQLLEDDYIESKVLQAQVNILELLIAAIK